ncbi:MAG: hypothetical protein JJU29_09530 [Verrucomicrobia bacterium]|nr:hypothetical protein [Verrucomicrobiota bacterium]MCH8510866.1 hypothetical protein [Kiritimatiellia bacterium]
MRRRTQKKIFRRGVYVMLLLTPLILGGLQMRRAAVLRAFNDALEPFARMAAVFDLQTGSETLVMRKDGEILTLATPEGTQYRGRIYGARFARISRAEPLPGGLAFLDWLVELQRDIDPEESESRLAGTLTLRSLNTISPHREAGGGAGHPLNPENHQLELTLTRISPGREPEILRGTAPGLEVKLALPPSRYQRDAAQIRMPSSSGAEIPRSLQQHFDRISPSTL